MYVVCYLHDVTIVLGSTSTSTSSLLLVDVIIQDTTSCTSFNCEDIVIKAHVLGVCGTKQKSTDVLASGGLGATKDQGLEAEY